MASTFSITSTSTAVHLDAQQRGEVAFTVSNTSGRSVRGRAKLVAQDPAQRDWLTVAGDTERDFPVSGAQQFIVQVAVPPASKEGKYVFRLDAVSVQNPDEDYTQGPTVAFTVAKHEPPKRWWIAAVAVAAVVLIGGLAVWLVERGKVAVPSITGKTLVDANTALTPLNLKIGNVTSVLGDPANVDQILSQSPEAGQKVASGSAVDVQVGVAIVAVPAVIGKAYNDAVSALHAALLDIGRVTNVNSPGVTTPGLVVNSSPAAGNSLKSHSTVDLVVQEQNVPVPNVVGQPFPNAVAALTFANLKLGTVTGNIYQVSGLGPTSSPTALVTGQSPSGGTVAVGSQVNLVFPNPTVSLNPFLVNQQAAKTSHW